MKIRYFRYKKCDVFGVGAISNAAASLASSIYAADQQYDATMQTNKLNKQLADERNALEYQIFGESNDFNAEQAELSRQHAWAMQKDAQEYNSIGAQIDRARAAGVNPAAVVNGSGTTPVSASPSSAQATTSPPNMVAAQMQVPDLSALQGISSAISNLGQSAESFASARKLKEETKGLESYNKFADAINAAKLGLSHSEIRKNYAAARQLQEDADLTREKVNEVKQHVALMFSQGKLIDEQAFAQNIENAFKSKEMELKVKNLATELQINEQNARYLMQTFSARCYGVTLQNQKSISEIVQNKSHANFLDKSATLLETQNSQAAFDYQMDRLFVARERRSGLAQSAENINQLEWENSNGVRAFNILCQGAQTIGTLVGGAGLLGGAISGARAGAKRGRLEQEKFDYQKSRDLQNDLRITP